MGARFLSMGCIDLKDILEDMIYVSACIHVSWGEREREDGRQRLILRNCLMRLWRPRSPTVHPLQDLGTLVLSSHPVQRPENWGTNGANLSFRAEDDEMRYPSQQRGAKKED